MPPAVASKTATSRCCGALATQELVRDPILGGKAETLAFVCSRCGKECRVYLDSIHHQNAPGAKE